MGSNLVPPGGEAGICAALQQGQSDRSNEAHASTERPYLIAIEGFDPHVVMAASPAKARYRDFLAYEEAGFGRRPGDWSTKAERFAKYLSRVRFVYRHFGPSPTGETK